MKRWLSVLLLAALFSLAACGSAEESIDNEQATAPPESGYPAEGESDSAAESAYPGTLSPTPVDTVPTLDPNARPAQPQPAAGTGAVVGRLYHGETNEPGSNIRVYLGEKVETESGDSYFVSTQRNTSPQAETDAQGFFVINDVEPGTYALVIRTPLTSKVLSDQATNEEIWVDVTADQVSDTGQVPFTIP